MFLFQVVFTPTLLVMLQTAVRNVQMVLTWRMTKNLENLYWTARHVLTVITEHVLFDVTKGFTHVIKCCLEAWKDWGKMIRIRTAVFIFGNNPSSKARIEFRETLPCVCFIVYGWFEDLFFSLKGTIWRPKVYRWTYQLIFPSINICKNIGSQSPGENPFHPALINNTKTRFKTLILLFFSMIIKYDIISLAGV